MMKIKASVSLNEIRYCKCFPCWLSAAFQEAGGGVAKGLAVATAE